MKQKDFTRKILNKNRRGGIMFWIIRIIIIILVLTFIVIFVAMFVKMKFDTAQHEASWISYKIYYSNDIITHYNKDIGTGFPGVIDESSLTNENLEKNLDYAGRVAVKITLKDFAGDIVKEAYNNETMFKGHVAQAKLGLAGRGGAFYLSKIMPITYLDKKDSIHTKKGFLIIEIVIPNTWRPPR